MNYTISPTHRIVAAGAVWLFATLAHAQSASSPSLAVVVKADQTIEISWPAAAPAVVLEQNGSLSRADAWLAVSPIPARQGDHFAFSVNPTEQAQFYRLRLVQAAPAFAISGFTPLDGATDVGVTVRPQISFSQPVNPATLGPNNFYASFGGQTLPATVVPANDGAFAWLFLKQPMPGGARVRITVDGSSITAAQGGSALDAAGAGTPGGVLTYDFTTVSLAPLAGTSLSGIVVDPGPDLIPRSDDDLQPGPDGRLGTADDVFLLPIEGVKVYLLGREDQVVMTGADGRFHFDAVPRGDVKVVVNGNTASHPPAGMYFPEMVIDAQMLVGVENHTMTNGPEVYLPRLAKSILQTVSSANTNLIQATPDGAPNLSAFQRNQLSITVAPNSLIGANGQTLTSGQIGISTVPSELVRDMLPPGVLQHTFDITIQAPGIATFSTPAPMSFPNVFNAAPGTKLNFLSFDHTTGRLVIEGTATVSADGASVNTDPGTGVTHPGWHGLTPPGGPNDPPCDPKALHDQDWPPLPVTAGIQNYFFSDIPTSQKQFLLSFGNAASRLSSDPNESPCSERNIRATPLVVEVAVDGAAEQFLDGLKSQTIMLLPGQKQDLAIRLKPPVASLQTIEADRFYGARVKIVAYQFGKTDHLLEKEIYIYRFLDALDINHGDGIVNMADTATSLTRFRPIEYFLGGLAKPTLVASPNDHFSNAGFPDAFAFRPKADSGVLTARLDVITPAGVLLSGALLLAGEAKHQKWYVDQPAFVGKLANLYSDPADLLDQTQKGLLDTDAKRVDLVSNAVHNAEILLVKYASGLYRVNTPDADAIRIDSFETPVKAAYEELGISDLVDVQLPAIEQLVKIRGRLSKAEQNYRLSVAMNQQASGSVQIYLRHYIGVSPRFSTAEQFASTIGKTIAHEIGHSVGLVHVVGTDDKGNVKFLGPSKADAQRDVMAQGTDFVGARRFELSDSAFVVAVGDSWSPPEAQKGVDYYGMFLAQGGGFDAIETGRDGNALPPMPRGGPIAWIFSETEGNFVSGSFDFGTAMIDGTNAERMDRSFTLRNLGDQALTVDRLEFTGSDAFHAVGLTNGATLEPMTELPFTLTFSPNATGPVQAELVLSGNALADPYEVTLRGAGKSPDAELRVVVANNNVGGAQVGAGGVIISNFATLTNAGSKVLGITGINANPGGGADQFAVPGLPVGFGTTQPIQLQPGQTFSLNLSFAPATVGLLRGELQITSNDPQTPVYHLKVIGTGLQGNGPPFDSLDYGNDYVAMESPDFPNGVVLRAITDDKGNFSFFLPSNQRYHAVIFDPVSGLVAHLNGITASSGQNTQLGIPVFLASTAPDTDGDGLADDLEFAIGTDPHKADTDGDGIDDFVAVLQGVDPLGGRGFPIGIVGRLPLEGEAKQVVVIPWTVKPVRQLAVVAAGTGGLALVDVTDSTQPVLLNQLPLPGDATDVAVDPDLAIAVVAANEGGIHFVDIRDLTAPRLLRTVADNAYQVEIFNGNAWVATATRLNCYGLLTGTALNSVESGQVKSMAREGSNLFIVLATKVISYGGLPYSVFRVFDLVRSDYRSGSPLALLGDSPKEDVSVGNGFAYITDGLGGYSLVDVTAPDRPKLVRRPDIPSQLPILVGKAMAVDGSGHGLMIGSLQSTFTPPFTFTYHLDLLSLADPETVYRALQTRIDLPSAAYNLAIASGRAFVAGGTSGLIVVNLIPVDTLGKAPTVQMTPELVDADPASPGVQVDEGASIPIRVSAVDDIQVRKVELLVNGVATQESITFPFNFTTIAPAIANGSNTFTIQVRATDTGGNSTSSDPLVVEIHRDTQTFGVEKVEPGEGEIRPPDFGEARIKFSKAITPGSANLANFFVIGPQGGHIPLQGIRSDLGGKEISLLFDELPPGQYTLGIHSAAVTDYAGNVLGPIDLTSGFTTKTFTIRWGNYSVPAGGSASWYDPTNWIPQRVPIESDSVYINVPSKDLSIIARLPTSPNPNAFLTNRISLQSLVCNEPLELFYIDLHVDELLQMNNTFTFSGSKLTQTRLRGGSDCVLQVRGLWTRGLEGNSLLDNVTLEGNIAINVTQAYQTGYDGQFRITNGLTLNGLVSSVGNPSIDQARPALEFYLDSSTIHGTGTFRNVNLYVGTEDNPANAQSGLPQNLTMTISSNITVRGGFVIYLIGSGTRLTNQGKLIAEEPHAPNRSRSGSTIGISAKGTFINEGSIEVQAGDRMSLTRIDGNSGPLINRGTIRVGAQSALFIGVPLISAKTVCEPGGICELAGYSLTTAAGNTSELAGAGTWLVYQFEFRGGTVKMTEGAVLEGSATFNDVTFEGELHNYDWSLRSQNYPGYLLGYGPQMSVITNLTLNGQIVFHDSSLGVLLFQAGTPRLGGHGRIEFPGAVGGLINSIGQLRVGVSTAEYFLQLSIGSDITIGCRNMDIGFGGSISDSSPPYIDNQGTLLANQLGEALRVNTLGFTNSGAIQVGSSNLVTFYGQSGLTAFTQTPFGKLQFDAAGTTPGTTHGQVQVQGAAALDGKLSLSFIPPFQPKTGDAFELLTYKSHTGAFSTMEAPPAPAGLEWAAEYGPTSFRLKLRAVGSFP